MKPRALILLAYGTNRDRDVAEALTLAGAEAEVVPLNLLRRGRRRWADYQILVVPGGFSYADALGAGKLLAIDLKTYFAGEIQEFVESGKPVIGICNGFQALVKSGILPGVIKEKRLDGNIPPRFVDQKSSIVNRQSDATLTFNASGRFECRWVTLKPVSGKCLWTHGLTGLVECPVAHGEGNFQVADRTVIAGLQANDQIALTYVCGNGEAADGSYPANPNGSTHDIAGITNPTGNVLGLMPHPENNIHAWQYPRRNRQEDEHRTPSGLALFKNAVDYVEG